MTQAPLLALPNFSQPFVIECDASGTTIGAVLMQSGCPIAFLSHTLEGRNLTLSTYEELLAIIISIKKWRLYFLRWRFVIRTDQKSLRFLLDQRITTPLQGKRRVILMGYDCIIGYKKGKEKSAEDAISHVNVKELSSIGSIRGCGSTDLNELAAANAMRIASA